VFRGGDSTLKNLAILTVQSVSIKTKLFAPELIKVYKTILYLFLAKVYKVVKCCLLIS
jgi:hypothetical protein